RRAHRSANCIARRNAGVIKLITASPGTEKLSSLSRSGGSSQMHRFSHSLLIAVTVFLATGFATAQNERKPPVVGVQQAAGGMDVIMAYAGTWKVTGERFATAHSDAGKEDSTLRNDCWKSGGYVACNQYVNGESKVLLVFTYNDAQKMYTSY